MHSSASSVRVKSVVHIMEWFRYRPLACARGMRYMMQRTEALYEYCSRYNYDCQYCCNHVLRMKLLYLEIVLDLVGD